MSIISKIFSGGATELVKGVGGIIDNLHTSKEEKLEAEKQIKDMNGRLLSVNKKLDNKNFIDRAPKDIIKHEKQKKENYKLDLSKLNANLESLQI